MGRKRRRIKREKSHQNPNPIVAVVIVMSKRLKKPIPTLSPYCDTCEDCKELGCNYHELTGFSHADVEGPVDDIETIEEQTYEDD